MTARRWLHFGLLLSVLLGVVPHAAAADAPTVEPRGYQEKLSAKQVLLGQPFDVEISIRHEEGQRFDLITQPSMGDFEVLGVRRDRRDEVGEAKTTFQLTLSAFALGDLTLPARRFEVSSAQGAGQFEAPAATIQVIKDPKGSSRGAGLYDFKPPEAVRVRSYAVFAWLAALLALVAVGFALARYFRRRATRVVETAAPLSLTDRTLRDLEGLRQQKLPAQDRAREHYFRLSEILRGYLGTRYGIEALECTSAELEERLVLVNDARLQKDSVMEFVHRSDFIKFARSEVSEVTCSTDLDWVVGLVRQTVPHVVPPVTNER